MSAVLLPVSQLRHLRRARRALRKLQPSRKLLALRVFIEWSWVSTPHGDWNLRLRDGRAVRGGSGFPVYFKSPADAQTYALRHVREIREQISNPYWGWSRRAFVRQRRLEEGLSHKEKLALCRAYGKAA